jgi:hypothetical protein
MAVLREETVDRGGEILPAGILALVMAAGGQCQGDQGKRAAGKADGGRTSHHGLRCSG